MGKLLCSRQQSDCRQGQSYGFCLLCFFLSVAGIGLTQLGIELATS